MIFLSFHHSSNSHSFIHLSLSNLVLSLSSTFLVIVVPVYNNSKIQKMNSQNNYDLLFKYIVVGDTSNCVV